MNVTTTPVNPRDSREFLSDLRQHYYTPPSFFAKLLAPLTTNTLYATLPLVMDVSHWNSKPDGTTAVDWAAMKAGGVIGAYCKLGEVLDSGTEESWMDSSLDSNLQGLADNQMLAMVYCYLNTAYFLNNQYTLDGYVNGIETGATELDQVKNILDHDVNVHLIVRKMVIGGTWANDYSKLKGALTRRIHAIVLDVERWEKVRVANATSVGSVWINAVAKKTAERLQFLMNRGYLPQMPIIFYSGKWFIEQYSPDFGVTCDRYDTICAGYYWNTGYTETTLPNFVANYLTQIPDTWSPRLFGGSATYGKKVVGKQITGDRFAFTENVKNPNGYYPVIDVNVLNMSLGEAHTYFSRWTDWDDTPPNETCPDGYTWDEVQGKCVPVSTDPQILARLTALETAVNSLQLDLEEKQDLINKLADLLTQYKG